MKLNPIQQLDVKIDFGEGAIDVGRLATKDHQIFFEYDASFIATGLEISPHRLPLNSGLYQSNTSLFEGLPGVFDDSLPDGWGRLLFDRAFENSQEAGPLDRLARVGSTGIGALSYHPTQPEVELQSFDSLDTISIESQAILAGEGIEGLDKLRQLNGGSAGARPKIQVWVDGDVISHTPENLGPSATPWIIKFPNQSDGLDAGAIEYAYALMAKEAGIEMPKVKLFPSKEGPGFFGLERFDYVVDQRLHVHSAAGLLHSDFRAPSLDYKDLIRLTAALTKDQRQTEKVFRLAVFNVLAGNKDDHGKNFSYLMNSKGEWSFAPAYDLTPSDGMFGHQSMMVMGESKNISIQSLLELATFAGIQIDSAQDLVNQCLDIVENQIISQ